MQDGDLGVQRADELHIMLDHTSERWPKERSETDRESSGPSLRFRHPSGLLLFVQQHRRWSCIKSMPISSHCFSPCDNVRLQHALR